MRSQVVVLLLLLLLLSVVVVVVVIKDILTEYNEVLSFEKKLAHPANSICLLMHVTSKRIEYSI